MSTEENKALVRRFIDALNNQDVATLRAVLASDLTESWAKALPSAYTRWPGHHVSVTDMIAEGDKVWARLATSGGSAGEWMGLPPTGKTWTNTGVFFIRIAGSKIIEQSGLFDQLNHIKQLGGKIVPGG